MHSDPMVQLWPLTFKHPPTPLHAWGPVHGCVAFKSGLPDGTSVHFPRKNGILHALHVVKQAESQHRPSTQFPKTQSFASEQACPVVFVQTPFPLQALLPLHGEVAFISFLPTPTGMHWPTIPLVSVIGLHSIHDFVHADTQQIPSTQKPLEQSPPVLQFRPAVGSYSSEVLSSPLVFSPPVTSTWPVLSSVAVWLYRMPVMLPALAHANASGLCSSAVWAPYPFPPIAKTLPDARRTSLCLERGVVMLPVTDQVPLEGL